jgi:hypothetical protein
MRLVLICILFAVSFCFAATDTTTTLFSFSVDKKSNCYITDNKDTIYFDCEKFSKQYTDEVNPSTFLVLDTITKGPR